MKEQTLIDALERIAKFTQTVMRPCPLESDFHELCEKCRGSKQVPVAEPTPTAKIAQRALDEFKAQV